jgi:hypothetical protein
MGDDCFDIDSSDIDFLSGGEGKDRLKIRYSTYPFTVKLGNLNNSPIRIDMTLTGDNEDCVDANFFVGRILDTEEFGDNVRLERTGLTMALLGSGNDKFSADKSIIDFVFGDSEIDFITVSLMKMVSLHGGSGKFIYC